MAAGGGIGRQWNWLFILKKTVEIRSQMFENTKKNSISMKFQNGRDPPTSDGKRRGDENFSFFLFFFLNKNSKKIKKSRQQQKKMPKTDASWNVFDGSMSSAPSFFFVSLVPSVIQLFLIEFQRLDIVRVVPLPSVVTRHFLTLPGFTEFFFGYAIHLQRLYLTSIVTLVVS